VGPPGTWERVSIYPLYLVMVFLSVMTGDDGFSYQVLTFFCLFYVLVAFEAAQAKQSTFELGVCSQRLMQYMYHQRHRPLVSLFFPPRRPPHSAVSCSRDLMIIE
jgi:hypothetical protein